MPAATRRAIKAPGVSLSTAAPAGTSVGAARSVETSGVTSFGAGGSRTAFFRLMPAPSGPPGVPAEAIHRGDLHQIPLPHVPDQLRQPGALGPRAAGDLVLEDPVALPHRLQLAVQVLLRRAHPHIGHRLSNHVLDPPTHVSNGSELNPL